MSDGRYIRNYVLTDKQKQQVKKMTEYAEGFEAGKKWMQNEIARNPSVLFDLLPKMANNLKAQLDTYKGQLTEEQRKIIDAGVNGEISHEQMLAELKKHIKDA